jgi:hypothetical protein
MPTVNPMAKPDRKAIMPRLSASSGCGESALRDEQQDRNNEADWDSGHQAHGEPA